MSCAPHLPSRKNIGAEVVVISYLGNLRALRAYWHTFGPLVEAPQAVNFPQRSRVTVQQQQQKSARWVSQKPVWIPMCWES